VSELQAEAAARLIVIGCGNPTRSDDGAGIAVIQVLLRGPHAQTPGVQLIDAGTQGMDVMFRARGAEHVVIVDASKSGSEAGAIFRLPGVDAMTPTEHGFTLHGLRWDHALYAGSKIFGADFVARTEVFLIESADLGYGLALSQPVQASVARVAELINAHIDHVIATPAHVD
jgi:hydrogenase maturation protease